jgi:hypothetical protein
MSIDSSNSLFALENQIAQQISHSGLTRDSNFQFGTWIPSLQIGNGIIQGEYTDRVGNWTRIGHQIFINGFFRLNYNEAQVEDALQRNTTVQQIRIGTLPFEANSGASIFNLMVSNNHFIQNNRPRFTQGWGSYKETEVLSVGARSIWGSPRMLIFAYERATTGNINNLNRMPITTDLFIQDLRTSTNGTFIEVRISGTYTAFPDLSTTDPVNTPPPTITQPSPPPVPTPVITVGSHVRINQTARTWATGQNIPTWVLGQIYTVSQLKDSNRDLLLEGINSWIRAEDVTLV